MAQAPASPVTAFNQVLVSQIANITDVGKLDEVAALLMSSAVKLKVKANQRCYDIAAESQSQEDRDKVGVAEPDQCTMAAMSAVLITIHLSYVWKLQHKCQVTACHRRLSAIQTGPTHASLVYLSAANSGLLIA